MGLVTCSKCKKIYNYEKYSGICPKCARYNEETSAAEVHQEYHNKYDGGYSHTAKVNSGAEQPKKKQMDMRSKIVLGVIIFVFASNIILSFLGAIFSFLF